MTDEMKEKFNILLVDDSEDDRLFMRRALRLNPRLNVVAEVCDGEEAIAYLSGQDVFNDREKHPFPDALLLDLKMPRKSGHEVLEWLQTQPFDSLIVIVMSGSFLPADITRSMDLGADDYHKKNSSIEEQEALVQNIEKLLNNHS